MHASRVTTLACALTVLASCSQASGPATEASRAAPASGAEATHAPSPSVDLGFARGMVAATSEPVFFLGAEADAPAIGYASKGVLLAIDGPAENGRVPVKVDGPLRVKAFMPVELVALEAQERGRLEGAPVYLAPGDRVQLLGPDADATRVRVRVTVRVNGITLPPFEGSYPRRALSAEPAPSDAEPIKAGTPHSLERIGELALYDAPNGALAVNVPLTGRALSIDVLSTRDGWSAVRLGDGPYVIGYTREALSPRAEPSADAALGEPTEPANTIPARLANEEGELKRIAAGTKLRFNDRIVAVLKSEGWARVLASYDDGQVDVFAAVDDQVAVRGLAPASALKDAP